MLLEQRAAKSLICSYPSVPPQVPRGAQGELQREGGGVGHAPEGRRGGDGGDRQGEGDPRGGREGLPADVLEDAGDGARLGQPRARAGREGAPKPRNPRHFQAIEGGRDSVSDTFCT